MPGRRALLLVPPALVLFVAGLALVALPLFRDGRSLERLIDEASAHLRAGRWAEARATLEALSVDARSVAGRLDGPVPSLIGIVPVVGRSVDTSRAIVDAGAVAAHAALEALPVLEHREFWRAGRVDLASLRPLRTVAEAQSPRLEDALASVRESPGWPLFGPVSRARVRAIERLGSAVAGARLAVDAIDLSEHVLGGEGRRRYFIAFENPAELRGAGGLWGNYGIVHADGGMLTLGRFGRTQDDLGAFATELGPQWFRARYERFAPEHDWRQLPSAPDFPTVATIAESNLLDAPGIGPVDGTIAVDPAGLSALLEITGPVRVAGWSDPVDADNVMRVTMHDAYGRFETNEERIAFLGNTAEVVWSRFLGSDISIRRLAASGLGEALRSKHIRLHFVRPDEQELAVALDAAGELGDAKRTIGLVTQNTAGNKMDWWLERRLDVDLELEGDGLARGEAVVTLINRGPASGEPRYVIGPFSDAYRPGYNNQFVRLYLPRGTAILPASDDPQIATELGFVVVEWDVSIRPGGRVRRTVAFESQDLWDPRRSEIDLLVRKQPSIHPDVVRVDVRPPWGHRLALSAAASCPARTTTTDLRIAAGVRGSPWGWIVGPWARDISCGGGP